MYRSSSIAGADDPVTSFAEMGGYVHTLSDPDSNSGFLVKGTLWPIAAPTAKCAGSPVPERILCRSASHVKDS
jgi:hypothetical protein